MIWPFDRPEAKLTFKESVWLYLEVWWWMVKGFILLPFYIIKIILGRA